MKKLLIPTAFIAVMMLMGCPLQTEKSIDSGSYDIPTWLIGKWKGRSNTESKVNTYLVKKDEDKRGNIKAYTCDEAGNASKDDFKTVIFSAVGDKVFINVYFPGDADLSDPGYYIYQFKKVSEKEFNLLPVKEHAINTDIDAAELKAWLMKHKEDTIYDIANTEIYKKD